MRKRILEATKVLTTNPLFSGSAILVFGSLLGNGVNYIYHFVMGRALGVEQYGVLVSIYSLLYIISIVPISSSVSIVKFVSSAKDEKEQYAIYVAIKSAVQKMAIIGAIVILLLSPLISSFLRISDVASVALVAPIFFLSLITLVNQSTSQGKLQFMGMVLPNISMSLVKLILGVILVLLGFKVLGAMIGVILGGIVAFVVSREYIKRKPVHKITKPFHLREFFKYSGPVLLQAIAFTSIMSSDVLLVKHFFPEFEAGLYGALSTLGKIIYFAAQPVTGAMFPVVSKRHTSGESHIKIFLLSFLITACIAAAALSFYALFPRLPIVILYGEKYAKAASELLWMGGFYAIYTLAYFLTNYYLSIGKTRYALLAIFAAAVQIIAITIYHSSLLAVIQISFAVMLILSMILGGIAFIQTLKK